MSAALLLGSTLPDQIVPGSAHRLAACLADHWVRTLEGGAAHDAVNVPIWIPLGLFGTLTRRGPVLVTALASAPGPGSNCRRRSTRCAPASTWTGATTPPGC
ncbi:hypothetical protein OG455_26920 [Kitasatospora sp. NBC_01287]|uniref:hypothetical protein n=1 Tax=Kitasatospora sp. NBC_01287 TaxID=2903573 RepID=UPI0022507AA0|nr:hypothetical protein [Kitasatospora sp. NBC_01287]MCX4749098.1 hypothetical protein [Kitasatospora sp. NBC_01287]